MSRQKKTRCHLPFIHIKSLPLDPPIDLCHVVERITKDIAQATGIGLEHITATWEFFQEGHYAVAGQAASRQPVASHPVIVDLLSPDFNDAAQIEKMLCAVAASISKRANVEITNIFIHHRQAHSGMVFDAGEVVEW